MSNCIFRTDIQILEVIISRKHIHYVFKEPILNNEEINYYNLRYKLPHQSNKGLKDLCIFNYDKLVTLILE